MLNHRLHNIMLRPQAYEFSDKHNKYCMESKRKVKFALNMPILAKFDFIKIVSLQIPMFCLNCVLHVYCLLIN